MVSLGRYFRLFIRISKNLCRSAAVSEDDPNNVILSTEAGAPASLLFHKNITPHHLKPSIVEHINHEPPRCDHNDRPWVRTSSASEHRRGHIKWMVVIIYLTIEASNLNSHHCCDGTQIRVTKCYRYDGYIHFKIFVSWVKIFERTRNFAKSSLFW